MSITTNHFAKLHAVEVGQVSEHLSIQDKRVLPTLNRSFRDGLTLDGIHIVVINLRSGFRKEVDQIVQFAEEHFKTLLPEVKVKFTEIIGRLTLGNIDATKEITGKLVRRLFAFRPDQTILCASDVSEKMSLTYLKDELIPFLAAKERIQQAQLLPTDEKVESFLSAAKELLDKNRPSDVEEIAKAAPPEVIVNLMGLIAHKYVQLQQFAEPIRMARELPDDPQKLDCLGAIIKELLDKDRPSDVEEIAKSAPLEAIVKLMGLIAQKYVQLQQFAEPIRMVRELPDNPQKLDCIYAIILAHIPDAITKVTDLQEDRLFGQFRSGDSVQQIDSNQIKRAIDLARSLQDPERKDLCLRLIAEVYAEANCIEEVTDLVDSLPNSESVNRMRAQIVKKSVENYSQDPSDVEQKARHYIDQISDGPEKIKAIFYLAKWMVSVDLDRSVALVKNLPKDLDLKKYGLELDRMAGECIRRKKYQEAAELIKRMSTEGIPNTDEGLEMLDEIARNSDVVSEIMHLGRMGAFTDATMLLDQFSDVYVRSRLKACQQTKDRKLTA